MNRTFAALMVVGYLSHESAYHGLLTWVIQRRWRC